MRSAASERQRQSSAHGQVGLMGLWFLSIGDVFSKRIAAPRSCKMIFRKFCDRKLAGRLDADFARRERVVAAGSALPHGMHARSILVARCGS